MRINYQKSWFHLQMGNLLCLYDIHEHNFKKIPTDIILDR
jgi:hypothetical protein